MDLNKIKAKAGISGPSAEEIESLGESLRSTGKRRFWRDKQNGLPDEQNGLQAERRFDTDSTEGDDATPSKGEQKDSKGLAKGEQELSSFVPKGEQKDSKGLAKGEQELSSFVPKGEQRASKGLAKGEQEPPSSDPKGEQRASKGLAKGEPKGEQENGQRVSKGLAKGEQEKAPSGSFGKLVGLQRSILLLIYESLQVRGEDLTDPMSSTRLAESLSSDRLTTKDALRRLREKGVLAHGEVKNGKGGWVRYAVPPIIRAEIFAWQRVSKGLAKGEPKGEQPPSSSSSYIINNFKPTPTVESETRARAEDVWTPEDLDYSMLTEIGFGRSQALQLRSLGLSFDVVQSSIVYFDFELRYTPSGKSIQAPLALLMKRMRQNGCWEAPEEYSKRHEYFRSRFNERERHVQEGERQGATASEGNNACPEVSNDQS